MISDRHRYEHDADDADQLHRRSVDFRQTFYTFILENIDKFGALKAIGAKSRELVSMILFQATFVSLTGYGLGVGLCALVIWLARARLPDYAAIITFTNLALGLRHGGDDRLDIELYRGAQGVCKSSRSTSSEASMAKAAIERARHQQMVWRGERALRMRQGRELRGATSARCSTSSARQAAARPRCSA